MIQANELRIGNWVNFHNDNTYFEVTEITKEGLGVRNETMDTWIEIDEFSPVPLTPEILEKCGFKDSEWEHKTKSECLFVGNDIIHIMDARDKNYSFTAPCKYLHQLQNLYFSLTGTELIINL